MNELRAIAASNLGIIRPKDLERLGLDRNGMRSVLRGLYPIKRGVYAVDRPKDPREVHGLRCVAALMAVEGSAASHISAAVFHGFPLFRPDLETVHICQPGPIRRGLRGGVHLHQSPGPYARAGDIPITTPAQTIIDCARTQPRATALVIADAALHTKAVTHEELRDALSAAGSAWGISRARSIVQLADGRAESVGETRSRLICLDAGLAVTPQVDIRDDQGHVIGRVDLAVDGLPLGIEYDGKGKYTDYLDPDDELDEKYWQEKVRKELIEDHGQILVPVYWEMLDRPRAFLARVQRAAIRAHKLAS